MKRRSFKLILFLLLGAIVNVAASYGCVFLSPGWPDGSFNSHSKFPAWPRDVPASWPAPLDLTVWSISGHTIVIARGEMRPDRLTEESIMLSHTQRLVQFGWPLRSIESESRMILWDGSKYLADAGTVADFLRFSNYPWRRVPLRPIWPGFAINTIFYAAILWMLTLGSFTALRLSRRKRGRCIKCGYDLRGAISSGCPECGWRREDVS